MNVRGHVAQNTKGRRSLIDRRTTSRASYGVSQGIRKRIEEGFDWIKIVGDQRKTCSRSATRSGSPSPSGRPSGSSPARAAWSSGVSLRGK